MPSTTPPGPTEPRPLRTVENLTPPERITDQTVQRRWEQATKVNNKGERVMLDPGGSLAQAQRAKTRYGIATHTLPNGYCGLPVQKTCPHANACLTCPVFNTGPEFLPVQRRRTLTLIEVSTSTGQTRVTEMNQQVLTYLDRIIEIGHTANNTRPRSCRSGAVISRPVLDSIYLHRRFELGNYRDLGIDAGG